MTASHDRRAHRHASLWRILRFAFVAMIVATAFSVQSPPPSVRADDLSDALAQQQKLQQEIDAQKKAMAQLQQQSQNLQKQIDATKSNLANVGQQLNETQAQINSLKKNIADVQAQYDQTVKKLADLESQLKSIEAQEADKAQELADRRALLAKRLVAAYQAGQQSLLEQLLQSKSIADLLSDISYYMDIGEADKKLALQIEQDQKTLAQLHATVVETRDATAQMRDATAKQKKLLDGQVQQLNEAQDRLAALQRQIQAQLAQQQANQAKLAQNQADLQKQIAATAAAQSALAKKIDELEAAQAAQGGIPSQYSGSLAWPMGGVISQEFGCTGFIGEPPLGNCAHFHQGIDIVAPCGTAVRSSGPGTVVFVGWNPYDAPPRAWIVIVAHASNLDTWYAHMIGSAPSGIYAGAHVSKGQLIGWEGSTGHSTGCHLHWAVRLNGQFVNPRLFV